MKPDNFLVGHGKKSNIIYVIDFGLAKTFMNSSNIHVKEEKITGCVGTQDFVSLNVHDRKLPSRRDDIESVVYIICYLFLPSKKWANGEECDIKLFKQQLSKNIECEKLSELIILVQSLSYYDAPCYDQLIEIIEKTKEDEKR
jgi:serine/threonine protein kinase